jgi:hypothetical protein
LGGSVLLAQGGQFTWRLTARMTQAAITRRPVPPNVTVRNARGFEADYTQTFDDSGRTYSRPGHISTSITWWRRIDPKTPQRIDRYYASPTYPASYVGWIDLKGETSHVDGSGTSGNDAKLMLTLEDLHGRWHSGKPLILVVGQRAQLDAAVVPVLNWIFSGNYYGMNLNWADATLQITTRALEANVARITVVAHLERPSFGRTASYDLTGELELELPSSVYADAMSEWRAKPRVAA